MVAPPLLIGAEPGPVFLGNGPQDPARHACGHHAQGAALLGLAAALREANVLDGLCGRIRLCAVPAEELDAIFDPRAFLTRAGVVFDRLEQLSFE